MKGKGIIMEIRPTSMVIMTNECGFEEIKKRSDMIVGLEIEFEPKDIIKKKNRHLKPLIAVAAAIVLLVVSSLFFIGDITKPPTTVALLTIDINPSIVLEINHNQEVINIILLNQEAEDLNLDLSKNQDVKKVIHNLINLAEEKGYLAEVEENYILLTTIFLEDVDDGLKQLPEELKKSVEESLIKNKGKSVVVVTLDSDYDTYLKAQETSTSVGKMEMFQRLEKTEEGIILEDIKDQSVKELIKQAEKKDHPVFEVHPSNKEEKQHPVFETHPSNKEEKHPVFETHPSNKEEKQHPVFETHPSNKEGKQHPVFETHPSIKPPILDQNIGPAKQQNTSPKNENKPIKPQGNSNSNSKKNN